MVGETLRVRSAEFEGSTSMSGGTIDRLLTSSVPPTKENSTLAAPPRCSSRLVTIVKELQFNVSIDIGLEEGEKSNIVSQRLD